MKKTFPSRLFFPLVLTGMLLLGACGGSLKKNLEETHYEVEVGEAFELQGDFPSIINWDIEDEFVVAPGEWPEEYVGLHVGTTHVFDENQPDFGFTVKVNPKNKKFTEPYMGWDESQDDIVARFGLPQRVDDMAGVLTYMAPGAQPSISYIFELQNLVGTMMQITASSKRTLDNFLAERYAIEETEDADVRKFARYSGKKPFRRATLVGYIIETDSYIHVLYAPSGYYLEKALEALEKTEY